MSDILEIICATTLSPFWQQEQKRALQDIEKQSQFSLYKNKNTSFRIYLKMENNKLIFEVKNKDEELLNTFILSLSPYRKLIKDYLLMIESYELMRRTGNLQKLEAIDMGRRGLHNEGAEIFIERLSGKAEMDFETARCFFTLICALYNDRQKPF